MKIKSTWVKFSLLTIVALIIVEVVSRVVTKNLSDNVYPMEADSVSIPILSTMLSFIALSPFAAIISFVSISKYHDGSKGSLAWYVIKVLSYLISYLILSFMALVGVMYWNTPHHFVISDFYKGLLGLIQAILIYDLYKIYVGYKLNK